MNSNPSLKSLKKKVAPAAPAFRSSCLPRKPTILHTGDLINRPILFRSVFLPEGGRLLLLVLPHSDDGGHTMSLIHQAITHLGKESIILINAILDGRNGVLDKYAADWAKIQGINSSDPDIPAIKETIRFEEGREFARRLGLGTRHDQWCMNFALEKGVYTEKGALDSYHSQFAEPTGKDLALMKERVNLYTAGPTCWVMPNPFIVNHPHHISLSLAILKQLADVKPHPRVFLYNSLKYELDQEKAGAAGEQNAVYLVYPKAEEDLYREILQEKNIIGSQDDRYEQGYYAKYFALYASTIARRLGGEAHYARNIFRIMEVGHGTFNTVRVSQTGL